MTRSGLAFVVVFGLAWSDAALAQPPVGEPPAESPEAAPPPAAEPPAEAAPPTDAASPESETPAVETPPVAPETPPEVLPAAEFGEKPATEAAPAPPVDAKATAQDAPFTLSSLRDFLDTRITFTLADNDLMRGPQESSGRASPDGSPSIPNGAPSGDNRLFFDDFERRDRGFENLTHLVVYAHDPGYFEGVDTEAALVLRMEVLQTKNVNILEDGSYLRVAIDVADDYQLAITAFPVSADRFRLGYSYDISWGGSQIFRNSKVTPGLKLDLKGPRFYAFAGFKTGVAQIDQNDGTVENDTVGGVLGGAGVDILDELRVEAGGGFFYRGTIDRGELRVPDGEGGVASAPWLGYGGSAQVTYHLGVPIGTAIDFRLYRNDPMQQVSFFKPETYPDGLSFLVQSEASVLGQTLQDFERPTTTTSQLAMAVDLAAKVKFNKVRIHVLAVFRTLEFMLFNVPSLTPYVDLPAGVQANPEIFAMVGADYFFEAFHLTPGVSFGIQRPAHATTEIDVGSTPPTSLGQQTIVVLEERSWTVLDPGDGVALVYAGKVTCKWDLSDIISAAGELQVSYDQNLRTFAQDPFGVVIRQKTDPTIVGFNLLVQARF